MRPRVARAALPKMKVTRIRACETFNSFFSVRMRGSGRHWSHLTIQSQFRERIYGEENRRSASAARVS